MKYSLLILAIIMAATGCSNSSRPKDALNDSDEIEAVEDEMEVVYMSADTTNIKGRWKLTKYHSPYFNMEPTGIFDYILKVSGSGMNIKFSANELIMEYTLSGDTLHIGRNIITQVKGADEPLETAITDLLFRSGVKTINITKSPSGYLTIMGEDGRFADFEKVGD